MTTGAELFPLLESLNFDVKAGVMLCGSDAAFYCELIEELHADVLPRRHRAIADPVECREYAHMLKGTLQTLGETSASMKARDLEKALREGTPHGELAAALLADLNRMDSALGRIFKGI
jgi:HPt (histidine-containing phosphotransfer) domain-containing protein